MMENDHQHIRREYHGEALTRADLNPNPHTQFSRWLQRALDEQLRDATAMSLATVSASGQPSVRIVLLKAHSDAGFVFYSDTRSQKGRELAANPCAELLFHWRELDRQVRISGTVQSIPRQDTIEYFNSRPLASRLSAAASEQSAEISDRNTLEAKVAALDEDLLTCPETWGGYCLSADQFEFWQGRENRLHDRFVYHKDDQAGAPSWQIKRLQP